MRMLPPSAGTSSRRIRSPARGKVDLSRALKPFESLLLRTRSCRGPTSRATSTTNVYWYHCGRPETCRGGAGDPLGQLFAQYGADAGLEAPCCPRWRPRHWCRDWAQLLARWPLREGGWRCYGRCRRGGNRALAAVCGGPSDQVLRPGRATRLCEHGSLICSVSYPGGITDPPGTM
jgi:hypothetical protein